MARMTTSSASDSGLQSFAGMFLQVWPSVARIQSMKPEKPYRDPLANPIAFFVSLLLLSLIYVLILEAAKAMFLK